MYARPGMGFIDTLGKLLLFAVLPQIGKSFININSIFAKTNNGNHGKQLQSLDVDTSLPATPDCTVLDRAKAIKGRKSCFFQRQYSVGILWESGHGNLLAT